MRMLASILSLVLFLYGALDKTNGNNLECFKLAADIVFAVDSSFSIREEDYQRQLTFLRALVDRFTIGTNNIQVAVVSFGSTVRPDIKLNDFHNNWFLKEAIGQIKQLNSGTHTYEAIHYIQKNMYLTENGGRPWVKRQMVLITDGLSSNTSATLMEASIAKSKGIEIFSILVGEHIDDVEIRGSASDPKENHVFTVTDYKALMSIENALSSAACHGSPTDNNNNGDEDNTISPPETACDNSAADIIFLMDSSSSIWHPDFKRQVNFIQQVVSSFDISKDAFRVGVVAYSDGPITLVDLSDRQTPDHIHESLEKAPYITGGTNTALAINHVRKQFLTNGVARPHAAHVIIILSDGDSNNLDETKAEADRAHAEGVYIFAVGIGSKANAVELMALASDPDDQFVLHVDNYEALSGIKELLAVKTCDAVAASVTISEPLAACPSLPTDVVFIYDTTALSRQHHNYVINIISEITESTRLNSQDLRVGVMREISLDSSAVLHDIELTNQWTQSNFKTLLDPNARTASVDLLLRKTRHQYFHPTFKFDYIAHRRTIVLFLDSLLNNPLGATIEARRLRRSHVNIVIITLGKHTNRREVIEIASSPQDSYIIESPTVEDFNTQIVTSKLLAVLCE